MIRTRHLVFIVACPFVLSGTASAQLKDAHIVVGGIHIRPTNVEAQKKFWIDTLGGKPRKLANNFTALFPDGTVEMGTPSFGCPPEASTTGVGTCVQKPWGGSKGTNANHVGMSVPDLRAMVDRVKAAGYSIVTRAELPPDSADSETDGIAFRADHNARVAIVLGPDDILVELVEVRSQKDPIAFHHVHLEVPDVPEMIAWYSKVFGMKPGQVGLNQAVLPGAMLTFSTSAYPMTGTRGRVLDHFVFEIRDLDAFVKQIQSMGIKLQSRYAKPNLPEWGAWGSVFLSDPWGTYLELTEGAYKVK